MTFFSNKDWPEGLATTSTLSTSSSTTAFRPCWGIPRTISISFNYLWKWHRQLSVKDLFRIACPRSQQQPLTPTYHPPKSQPRCRDQDLAISNPLHPAGSMKWVRFKFYIIRLKYGKADKDSKQRFLKRSSTNSNRCSRRDHWLARAAVHLVKPTRGPVQQLSCPVCALELRKAHKRITRYRVALMPRLKEQ